MFGADGQDQCQEQGRKVEDMAKFQHLGRKAEDKEGGHVWCGRAGFQDKVGGSWRR